MVGFRIGWALGLRMRRTIGWSRKLGLVGRLGRRRIVGLWFMVFRCHGRRRLVMDRWLGVSLGPPGR